MPVSKRLHGPALVAAAAATKYTTPSNVRTKVRHIHISNPTASPVDFTLSIGVDAVATRLFDGLVIPADSVVDYWGPYTLAAAEIVQAGAGTTNVLTLTIDGEEELAA